MTDTDASPDADAPLAVASAGDMLRSAREAVGMSVDTVAQQLKLAPRQVRAIEDGNFTQLPGRTFVRGFIRNYARLVNLDAESVLGALPAGSAAPALDSPTLQATAPTIGELPTTEHARPGWTRWAIPLTLIAIIAATAVYEFMHPGADVRPAAPESSSSSSAERAAPNAMAPEIIGTPLPNPVSSLAPPASAPPVPALPAAAPVIAAPKAAAVPPPEMRPNVPPTAPIPSTAPPLSTVAALADAPLTLVYRDFSWTEVKDRNGRVLISRMNPGGTTQSVTGVAPFDVVIGNASDVTLMWKGKLVDLGPHTRGNVARFTLE